MSAAFDAIVVGSGPAGVSAALPLLEGGWRVAMLDGGSQAWIDPPQAEFLSWRRQEAGQWRWMVGEDFHALRQRDAVSPKLRVPTQAYAFDGFADANRIRAEGGFVAVGSLATGGLSNAWGCGVARFTPAEGGFAFAAAEMDVSYERVARRMGISGAADDDLAGPLGVDAHAQPPLELDALHAQLWRRYAASRERLVGRGFRLGRSRVAVLTQPRGERAACNRSGNCLWGCARGSLWSAAQELPALRRAGDLQWLPDHRVHELRRAEGGQWQVLARTSAGTAAVLQAPRLLLAAGTLATTRLVLQALAMPGPLRLLSCPTAAFLLWLPRMTGTPRAPGFGLGQLSYTLQLSGGGAGFGSTFATTTLPMWDLARHLPLHRPAGMRLLRHLLGSCVVGNLFLPGDLSNASVRLDPRHELIVGGGLAQGAPGVLQESQRALAAAWRALGAWMLPGSFTVGQPGSDIHYAGTLPMSVDPRPGGTSTVGEVVGLPGVHVVDGACLPALPGKSHTLTLMANADRIGRLIAHCPHP